jgi:hypothetical protein
LFFYILFIFSVGDGKTNDSGINSNKHSANLISSEVSANVIYVVVVVGGGGGSDCNCMRSI